MVINRDSILNFLFYYYYIESTYLKYKISPKDYIKFVIIVNKVIAKIYNYTIKYKIIIK